MMATVTGKVDTGVTTIIFKNNSTVNGVAHANTED